MLFKFNKKGNVVIEPEALKLTKYIKKLDEKQLLFVILFCDYSSKYHQLPIEERMFVAKKEVYADGSYPIEKDKNVELAIEEYESLQYDTKRETLKAYINKISSLTKTLIIEQDLGAIAKIDRAIKTLTQRLDEIQKEINADDSEIKTINGDKLSMIEKWQKNMVEYNKMKRQKEEMSGIVNITD